ncbi:MAG: hypothetical protein JG777_2013 [Clostridia bacterium]|jgi:hypothetical protein|uniref:hypothetical protein n=1 Tax=Petroclostridium xylanilyticum TaxID=1792311 RepID=UPI000B99CADF|nr:hypothetical protein [Petroclostridium xylanilyticum]MBZ4646524.1 hypothetical protein [Clostridia bacterium]
MVTVNGQSHLLIQNSIAFLDITDFNDIFSHKQLIDENIASDKIVVFAVIWNSQHIPCNKPQAQKLELYKWLNSLPILSIIVVDTDCYDELLELMMMFDIRLSGKNISIRFPDDDSKFVFNFEERCQLLMGNEINVDGYRNLLKKTLYLDDVYVQRLINQIIDIDDIQNEVQKYVNRIISNKDNYHIKSIIKCFNNYKLLGLKADRKLLLEEEAKQFCALIVKSYLKMRS